MKGTQLCSLLACLTQNLSNHFNIMAGCELTGEGRGLGVEPPANFSTLQLFTSSAPRGQLNPSGCGFRPQVKFFAIKMHKTLHFLLDNSTKFLSPDSTPQWAPNPLATQPPQLSLSIIVIFHGTWGYSHYTTRAITHANFEYKAIYLSVNNLLHCPALAKVV